MKKAEPEIKYLENHCNRPGSCPKCGKSLFIYHEDGWQCFNCM